MPSWSGPTTAPPPRARATPDELIALGDRLLRRDARRAARGARSDASATSRRWCATSPPRSAEMERAPPLERGRRRDRRRAGRRRRRRPAQPLPVERRGAGAPAFGGGRPSSLRIPAARRAVGSRRVAAAVTAVARRGGAAAACLGRARRGWRRGGRVAAGASAAGRRRARALRCRAAELELATLGLELPASRPSAITQPTRRCATRNEDVAMFEAAEDGAQRSITTSSTSTTRGRTARTMTHQAALRAGQVGARATSGAGRRPRASRWPRARQG